MYIYVHSVRNSKKLKNTFFFKKGQMKGDEEVFVKIPYDKRREKEKP